ncbi:MAG TPA: hypothetical protein EYP24_01545 [bacterium (Candidatus Stahlbacteria)]|nr:hypothetical protein [Candidatus Stahlbacteria bacterium]
MRISVLLFFVPQLTGGVITQEVFFSKEDLIFTDYGRYTLVELKSSDQISESGEPILPAPVYHFVIPPDGEIKRVEVIEEDFEYLPGLYLIHPGQKPRPLGKTRVKFQRPKAEIYNSDLFYPDRTFESTRSGLKGGFRLTSVRIYPLRYRPKSGRLRLSTRLRIRIYYQEGMHKIKTVSERQYQVQKLAVMRLVLNKNDVDRFKPLVRSNSIDDVNYAIVTGPDFVDSYQPIAYWKTKKGWMARVFSTEWIYANYLGIDNQEKIRNFFRDYYENKGLIWALLGGDVQIVPVRHAYSTYYQPYYIPTDWYYWDLDSNWNRDGDNHWGEIGDVLPSECYYEIYGGRDPIDDRLDIAYFTSKLLTFEKNPPDAGITTIVLVAADSSMNGSNEAIARMFPPWWKTVWVIGAPAPATRDTLNTYQPQFCHLATHGNRNGFYTSYGQPIFTENDVPNLTNDLPTIFNSIASHVGQFDYSADDCIGEELINFEKGGIASMFNARYGFGGPPNLGPSERLDTTFYHMVCYTDTLWLGVACASAHEHFANPIWSQGVWHYCGLEQNLLGEPEMGMYLKKPIPLSITFPETIEVEPQSFTITVADSAGPVEDALVCCYKEGELHESGWTDATGTITLNISPQTPGIMFVTASCFNHLPVEDTSIVVKIGISESHPEREVSWSVPTVVHKVISIRYTIREEMDVGITLYDILGRKVRNLVKRRLKDSGEIKIPTSDLSTGIYYLTIDVEIGRDLYRLLIVR